MTTTNIYKVYVDVPSTFEVEVWTVEAKNPASAISTIMQCVSYGDSAQAESFSVSAELEARNMTYAEYEASQQGVQNPIRRWKV
jgi:hypothetical protein